MGFSNNLGGATLTVALPLGLIGAVVLWGFFGRRPGRGFGGTSTTTHAGEHVGRPEIQAGDPSVQHGGGSSEPPLS
jgi:hypothetical protein